MLLKYIFISLTLIFSLSTYTFAQDEIPEDVIVGGKAKCVINGRAPFRRFIADGNRLLILQSGDFNKGSISIQSIFENKRLSNDINILALLGTIPDVDSFLSGETLVFEDSDSDLEIKSINKTNNVVLKILNLDPGGVKSKLLGRIKITSSDNEKVSGITRLSFKKSAIQDLSGSTLNLPQDNGRMIIICRFKDVPLAIKDLAF